MQGQAENPMEEIQANGLAKQAAKYNNLAVKQIFYSEPPMRRLLQGSRSPF